MVYVPVNSPEPCASHSTSTHSFCVRVCAPGFGERLKKYYFNCDCVIHFWHFCAVCMPRQWYAFQMDNGNYLNAQQMHFDGIFAHFDVCEHWRWAEMRLCLFGGTNLINCKWSIVVVAVGADRRKETEKKERTVIIFVNRNIAAINKHTVAVAVARARHRRSRTQTTERNLPNRQKATTVKRIVS